MQQRRPNFVVFLTDQQRWDTAGCYGQPMPTTPNLDAMARTGTLFRHAFTPQPLCTPARACIQTGRYATETGNFMLDTALPLNEETIADRLSAAGYEVGYLRKWHLADHAPAYADPAGRPGQREAFRCESGFVPPDRRGGYRDFWLASNHLKSTSRGYGGQLVDGDGREVRLPEDRYRVDAMTDLAIDFLRREHDRPFLLFLSYIEPHWQNDRARHDAPRGGDAAFLDAPLPGDLAGSNHRCSWLEDDWRHEYPRYLACVKSLDDNLGRLHSTLAERDLAGDTVVVQTSDHGCHFGKHNAGAKDSCHDASIRVPLVLDGPGFRGGGERPHLASLLDLAPTMLRAAGLPLPAMLRGLPLQDAVARPEGDWREEVFFQLSPSVVGRGVRTRRWKFAVRAPGADGFHQTSADAYEEDFLFDLERDPHELANLVRVPSLAAVREDLRQRLVRCMLEAAEPEPRIDPAPGS